MTFEAIGAAIGAGAFWRVLGARPLGAMVITCRGPAGPEGFLGLSFAHVSAAPPRVLVSVGHGTSALPALRAAGAFAANLLGPGDEALARAFGGALPAADRFDGVEHAAFVTGAPVLARAEAVFDCRVLRAIEDEAAVILLADVEGVRARGSGRALVAMGGGYRAV